METAYITYLSENSNDEIAKSLSDFLLDMIDMEMLSTTASKFDLLTFRTFEKQKLMGDILK